MFSVLSLNLAELPFHWEGFPWYMDCILLPARGSGPLPCSQRARELYLSLLKDMVKNFTFPGTFLGVSVSKLF